MGLSLRSKYWIFVWGLESRVRGKSKENQIAYRILLLPQTPDPGLQTFS